MYDENTMSSEEMACRIARLTEMERDLREERDRLELTLLQRMEAESATEWAYGHLVVKRQRAPVQYDTDKLKPLLKELLTEEEHEKVWIHPVVTTRPGAYHVGELGRLAAKRGKAVQEALDKARLPSRASKLILTIK